DRETSSAMPKYVRWPALPFYKLTDEGNGHHHRRCSVEFTDGRMMRSELIEFDPASGEVTLKLADAERSQRLELDQIRSIRIMRPARFRMTAGGWGAVGGRAPKARGGRRFEIAMPAGPIMTGPTWGFVKEPAGVFLFVVEGQHESAGVEKPADDKPVRAFHCFIP